MHKSPGDSEYYVALFGVIHVILFYSRRLRISTGFIRINVNKTRISGLIRSLRKKHPTFEDESYPTLLGCGCRRGTPRASVLRSRRHFSIESAVRCYECMLAPTFPNVSQKGDDMRGPG